MTMIQTSESDHTETNANPHYDHGPLVLVGPDPQSIYVHRVPSRNLGHYHAGFSEPNQPKIYLGGIKCINPRSEEDGPNYNTKLLTLLPAIELFDMECDLPCSTEPTFVMCAPSVDFEAVYDLEVDWTNQSASTKITIAPSEAPAPPLPPGCLEISDNNPQTVFVRVDPTGISGQIQFALEPGGPYFSEGINWNIQPSSDLAAKVLTLMLEPTLYDIGTDLLRSPRIQLPEFTCVVVNVPRGSLAAEYHFDVYDTTNTKTGIDPKIKSTPPTDPTD